MSLRSEQTLEVYDVMTLDDQHDFASTRCKRVLAFFVRYLVLVGRVCSVFDCAFGCALTAHNLRNHSAHCASKSADALKH